MSESVFQDSSIYARDLPAPAVKFAGLPRYNFIGGHNDPVHIPIEGLVEAAASVIRREGRDLAMYNLAKGPQGYPGLRQVVADKLQRHRGVDATADDVLVVTGSGQAINMIVRLLINPGDTVLLEEFCYAGSINRFRAAGAETVGLSVDEQGIRMDALEETLVALKAKGTRPKFLYTIPTIQNPTGSVLPLERRKQLIAICKKYGVPIFEDECYADLVWAGSAPPALYGLDPSQVLHIGSFSKNLAPALRLGYIVAPWDMLAKLIPLKADSGTGALDQMIVAEYFAQHYDEHVPKLTAVLKDKRDTMIEAMEREFGTHAQLYKPEGGIFMWIKLPDEVDVTQLIAPAAEVGVAFNPGPEWSVDAASSTSYLRLCFGSASKEDINEGVKRLARVCYEHTGIPARSDNAPNK
ncbi:MAG: 2-aminoadipate transaminase [Gammaproteobacteria bacterium]|jgi:2-aminoadipate transaminase